MRLAKFVALMAVAALAGQALPMPADGTTGGPPGEPPGGRWPGKTGPLPVARALQADDASPDGGANAAAGVPPEGPAIGSSAEDSSNPFHFTSPQDVSRPRGGSRMLDSTYSILSGGHLVWVQDTGNGSRIVHVRLDGEGGKLINDEITSSPNTSSAPRLVPNTDGSIDIVWLDNRTGAPELYLTVLSPTDGFVVSERRLTNSPDANIEDFEIDSGPAGEICAVLVLADRENASATGGSLVLLRFDANGNESSMPVELLRTRYRPLNLSLDVDAGGIVHLAWVELFGPEGQDILNPGIFYARFDGSGALEAGPEMVTVASLASTTAIIAEEGGGAAIAFDDDRYHTSEVFYTRVLQNGSPAVEDTMVSRLDQNDSLHPDIARGAEGELYVAWQDLASGRGDILVASVVEKPDGDVVVRLPCKALSTDNISSDPKLVLDRRNDLFVTWLETGAGANRTNRTDGTTAANLTNASADVMFSKSCRPDLTVRVAPEPGAAFLAGCATAFRVTVQNDGKGGSAATAWSLAQEGVAPAQGSLPALEGGESWTGAVKLVLKRGPQRLAAAVDSPGTVAESLEGNNGFTLDIVGIYYDIEARADPLSPILPGANATIGFAVTNRGNSNDSFNLTIDGPASLWMRLATGPHLVTAAATRRVDAEVAVPAGTAAGTYALNITAVSLGPTGPRAKLRLDVPVAYAPNIYVQMPSVLEVLPGSVGRFNLSALNAGNGRANLTVNVSGLKFASVAVSPGSLVLNRSESKTFKVNVSLPPGVLAGRQEALSVEILDQISELGVVRPTIVASANITIISGKTRGVAVEPEILVIDLNETGVLYMNVTFTNMGNTPENFTLRTEAPNKVKATLDRSALELGPGAGEIVGVRIEVSVGCYAGEHPLRFRARTRDGAVETVATSKLRVEKSSGLELLAERPAREVVRGAVRLVAFPVTVSNTGNYRDTYEFYLDGGYLNYTLDLGDKKASDWRTLDTARLALSPGENRTIVVNWLVTSYQVRRTTNLTFKVVSLEDRNVTASVLLQVKFKEDPPEGLIWVVVALAVPAVGVLAILGLRARMIGAGKGKRTGSGSDDVRRRLAIQKLREQAAIKARAGAVKK